MEFAQQNILQKMSFSWISPNICSFLFDNNGCFPTLQTRERLQVTLDPSIFLEEATTTLIQGGIEVRGEGELALSLDLSPSWR